MDLGVPQHNDTARRTGEVDTGEMAREKGDIYVNGIHDVRGTAFQPTTPRDSTLARVRAARAGGEGVDGVEDGVPP